MSKTKNVPLDSMKKIQKDSYDFLPRKLTDFCTF